MTSAQGQGWRRLHNWADVIHADFQTVISRVQQNISTNAFCTAERMVRTVMLQNSRLIQACFPIKIDEVWIDRFCVRYDWWRRLQRTSSVSPVCIYIHDTVGINCYIRADTRHNPATHHRVVHNPAAHHRVAGLCAAWWCTAGLCVGRLVCIEGRPWISNNLLKQCSCRDVNHQRYFTACAVLISACAQSQAIVSMYKCYHIVNRFLRNKSEWHVTQNTHISIRH